MFIPGTSQSCIEHGILKSIKGKKPRTHFYDLSECLCKWTLGNAKLRVCQVFDIADGGECSSHSYSKTSKQ